MYGRCVLLRAANCSYKKKMMRTALPLLVAVAVDAALRRCAVWPAACATVAFAAMLAADYALLIGVSAVE